MGSSIVVLTSSKPGGHRHQLRARRELVLHQAAELQRLVGLLEVSKSYWLETAKLPYAEAGRSLVDTGHQRPDSQEADLLN